LTGEGARKATSGRPGNSRFVKTALSVHSGSSERHAPGALISTFLIKLARKGPFLLTFRLFSVPFPSLSDRPDESNGPEPTFRKETESAVFVSFSSFLQFLPFSRVLAEKTESPLQGPGFETDDYTPALPASPFPHFSALFCSFSVLFRTGLDRTGRKRLPGAGTSHFPVKTALFVTFPLFSSLFRLFSRGRPRSPLGPGRLEAPFRENPRLFRSFLLFFERFSGG